MPSENRHADAHEVHRARNGNQAAFETLVRRHERRIYGLARRLTASVEDAQDVTQETFLTALRRLRSLRKPQAFGSWLTTIATRAALKLARQRRHGLTRAVEDATGSDENRITPRPMFIADWRETPDELAQRADTRRHLDAAIAALPALQRAAFLLRDVEGFSVRETAKALGISEGNVKIRLLRARLALREKLTRVFADPAQRTISHAHTEEIAQP